MSAHRGGSYERCENTISAFQHAVDNDVKILELDVHLTLDEKVIVTHDANLGRFTGLV